MSSYIYISVLIHTRILGDLRTCSVSRPDIIVSDELWGIISLFVAMYSPKLIFDLSLFYKNYPSSVSSSAAAEDRGNEHDEAD